MFQTKGNGVISYRVTLYLGPAVVFFAASFLIAAVECSPSSRFDRSFIFDVDIELHQSGVHHRAARKTGRGSSLDTWSCETVISLPDNIRADFPLDPFYQKYTHAYGIPIISSDACSDAALIRGCYTVRFLLADRKDIRDAMFDHYGRVGVIAQTENTTEIPEHSHLDSSIYDNRARGLGGVPNIPITTNAEENLICGTFEVDRWFEEDILIHEFAHSIHLISLNWISSTFQTDLEDAYNSAKADGMWQNTYAITKPTEYFAEGVQAFFNVQVCQSFTDYVHNGICTREILKESDPRLYSLIEDVFPCKNVVVDRCETDQGLAAAQVLKMNCDVTTGFTTTARPGTSPGTDPGTGATAGTGNVTGGSSMTAVTVASDDASSNHAVKIAVGVIVPVFCIIAGGVFIFVYKHFMVKTKVASLQ